MRGPQKYTLNVFTNVADIDPKEIPIKETLDSFEQTFTFDNVHAVNIFVHSQPFYKKTREYRAYLSDVTRSLPSVTLHSSRGLAHAYVKSLYLCETEYCFQLEHDWFFNKESILHSDVEILMAMSSLGVHHLRFNKRATIETNFDFQLKEESANGIVLCRTPGCSNNPHFLNRDIFFEKYLPLIHVGGEGAKGIEEFLSGVPYSCIYGPLNHPATITHNDGRGRMRRLRRALGPRGLKWVIRAGFLEQALRAQDYLEGWGKRGHAQPVKS